jgi:uncharacterized membrane protein HdeD (DUF308 family)
MPAASGQRGWLVFQGILGIAIGVVTYVSPNITAFALLYVVGAWAILLGITQLVVAFRFPMERSTKVMLVLYGIVCIAFGVLMYARPGNGALALVALIAAFAMVTGATLVALGVLVRREGREAVTGLFPTSDPTTPDASHEVKAS